MAPVYNEKSKGVYNLKPLPGEKFYSEWDQMTRFEKICWSWMHSYETLLEIVPAEDAFQFEKAVSEYEYFKQKVLFPLNLFISKDEWMITVNKKSPNSTKTYAFPHWKEWPAGQIQAFEDICGPTMLKLGYML